MVEQQTLTERWEEVCQRLRQRWGELSAEDLRAFRGDFEQLVEWLQHRTGERRAAIRQFFDEISADGVDVLDALHETAEQAAEELSQRARRGYETLREGYSDAEGIIKRHPGQSLAVAFGLGLVSGLTAAIVLGGRARRRHDERSRHAIEQLGRHVLDSLASIAPESVKQRFRGQ
jgi:ElaB/YqjD/DUF883 family membrane-anchored ribosome-binding protein